MLKILSKNKDTKQLADNDICNSNTSNDVALILELVNQIQKQTQAVIKEEGASTVNFNSLLNNEDYTKEQTQNVQKHLESVALSSTQTKQLLEKIISGMNTSFDDVSNAKTTNALMVTEMNNIIGIFDQINLLFDELQAEYNQIENLAAIISGIANKTKMLSLNASIEAARAGEHGKGFLVVADEIKKLSDSTKINARNIMSSLESMTLVIEKLNNKTAEGTQIIPSTQELLNSSTAVFNNITMLEDKLMESLEGVMNSQDDNITQISQINSDLLNIITKADSDNTQYKNLVVGVQKKADYYLHLLHYLKQIEILKQQMAQ
jgi:methyl-accepting chemotaxis protein